MRINVEFYGVLNQVMGAQALTLELAGNTVRETLEHLCQQQPGLMTHLPRVACAIGSEIVTREHALTDHDTLALIPPVSGGCA